MTFYKSADQLPSFKDYRMAGRTYRYFKGEELYPFGHGLSYTKFSYGKPVLSRASVRAGERVEVTVNVTNSGERDGAEVVQLYVSRQAPGAPIRSLQGFQRVHLKKGETQAVRFVLDEWALSLVDAQGQRAVEPGRVDLWIGGGQSVGRPGLQAAPGIAAELSITGRKRLPN